MTFLVQYNFFDDKCDVPLNTIKSIRQVSDNHRQERTALKNHSGDHFPKCSFLFRLVGFWVTSCSGVVVFSFLFSIAFLSTIIR